MKKGFYIELYNIDTYPTESQIRETIINDQGINNVEFIDNISFLVKNKSIIFKLKDGTYEVEVRKIRFWYVLYCREIN
ncbi:hypothetical protein SDC9_157669 [bioreactor metagenome]|uniref:Uncharacterized protein n=1 Tax=bioreactor metagenome TaxID=1076179 RepID=A0A645FD07_9ZZZZ|nr:hypothetical protein [Romboutsia lituseburensis]